MRVVEGVRDIPYTGVLIAALARTDSRDGECARLALIFDDRNTLIVDCLHSEEEIRAFYDTCGENRIERVSEVGNLVPRPCPPPENQLQVEAWAAKLFSELRPR